MFSADFHTHFPAAIATAAAARDQGRYEYKWMTQAWLVNAYRHCNTTTINLDGPGHPSAIICPNATALQSFEKAVRQGDIVWHAFPFNAEFETMDPSIIDAAFDMVNREDEYFGHAHRTTVSQRDVPGLTRAAIPLLSKRNVSAVSVGENLQVG